jgi:hypothetical protein
VSPLRVMFVLALVTCLVSASELRAADPKAEVSLADALTAVKCDDDTWTQYALLALGIEIGIPERAFREALPQNGLDSLPLKVLATLRQGPQGISAWLACLKDQRPTRITKDDLFSREPSRNAKKMTVAQAALTPLQAMVPRNFGPNGARDVEQVVSEVSKRAPLWETRCRSLSPNERMREWFRRPDRGRALMFLAVVIEMRHAPAYPLLEARFLSRANNPDPFLLLEVCAYIRHRRKDAADFESRIAKVLRESPLPSREKEMTDFCLSLWPKLVKNTSLEGDIQDCLAGRIDFRTLYELAERSVDQPWAYHSMSIEPVAVGRPIAAANLRSLVAAADGQHEIEKLVPLLMLAEETALTLKQIIRRADKLARRPLGRSDSPEWEPIVGQLKKLLDDNRPSLGQRTPTTPGQQAAKLVWQLWGPNTDEMAIIFHGAARDWRGDDIDFAWESTRWLMVEAAKEFLAHPDGVRAQALPADGAALSRRFTSGKAADWRRELATLRWDQRLLVQVEARRDPQFALRLWPRMIELVDYQVADSRQAAAFAPLWRDKLTGHNLDATTWAALRDFVVSEARADRWWVIFGETSPCRPGITLSLFPGRPKKPSDHPFPIFDGEVDGRVCFFAKPERFRITSTGLDPLGPDKDEFYNAKDPSPIEALERQSKRTVNDKPLSERGFDFYMLALPAKH